MYKTFAKIILPIAIVILLGIGPTNSYFSVGKVTSGNTLSTGYWAPNHIVINEIFYQGNSKNGSHGHDDDDEYRHHIRHNEAERDEKSEWIELYNPTNKAINLKGYTIFTSETTHKITATRWLKAGGYILISHDSSTWHQWDNPKSEKINLGGCPEKWLKDEGDYVYLKDNTKHFIDGLNYGSNLYFFSPSIPLVATGHSFERKDSSLDTDTAADFRELLEPTPGK